MTFPLVAVSVAVAVRVETWVRLGLRWRTSPIQPNYGKPVVSVEFESSAWLAEVMIWVTGETELATVRLSDDRMVNKHYELAGVGGLDVLLDELVGLLIDDRIPGAMGMYRLAGHGVMPARRSPLTGELRVFGGASAAAGGGGPT